MTQTIAPYDVDRPTPQASTAIATAQPPQVSDAGPRATMAGGNALIAIGEEADRYGLHLDTVMAQDALNKVRSAKADLTYGENGFLQTKGFQAIDPNRPGGSLMTDYKGKLQAVSDGITSKLSPRAQSMLKDHLGAENTAFKSDIAKHMIQQSEVYDTAVLKDGLAGNLNEAARYYNDPAKLDEYAARSAKLAADFALKRGMPAPAAAVAAASNVYVVGVKSLLDNGAQRQAVAYFDSVQNKLDAGDRIQLAAALRTTSDEIQGDDIANRATAKVGLPGIPSTDTSNPNVVPAARTQGQLTTDIATIQANATKALGALNIPVSVLSGHRDPATNAAVGGAQNSEHLHGNAIDVSLKGLSEDQKKQVIDTFLSQPGVGGFGYYPNSDSIHVDARKGQRIAWGIDRTTGSVGAGWAPWMTQKVADWQQASPTTPGVPGVPGTSNPSPNPPGFQFKGEPKLGYTQAAMEVMTDPTITNPRAKAAAVAKLLKFGNEFSAIQTAGVKAVRDEANTVMATAFAQPDSLKPGTFAALADKAQGLGEQELATRYRYWASMEGDIKNGLSVMPADRLQFLKSTTEGLPHQILEAVGAKGADLTAEGQRLFEDLKKAHANGLDTVGLTPLAEKAARAFAQGGNDRKAREVAEWTNTALQVGEALKLPQAQQQEIAGRIEQATREGKATAQNVEFYNLMKQGWEHQDAAFRSDAWLAGTRQMGIQPPAFDLSNPQTLSVTLAQRAAIADRINAARPGSNVILLSKPEVAGLREFMAKAGPDGAMKVIDAFSALPDEHKLSIAAALAGKGTADPLSQMYGGAMAKFAENTPEGREAGFNIVRGAEIIKNAGINKSEISASKPVFQQTVADKIGTALHAFAGTEVPSEMVEAIRAEFAWRSDKAGKQFDSNPDDTLLRQSIDAVTGGVIKYRGQQVFAPRAGASSYDLSNAVSTLRDSDLPELKSEEGKPITADMIKSKGVLYSVGPAMYLVKLPDRGGELKPIMDPRTGRGYVLGITGLMDRPAATPEQFSAGTAQP